jgi:hypothetical protein
VADFELDISGIKKLYKDLEGFDEAYDRFLDGFTQEVGNRAQALTKQLTPVGVYPAESGLKGGSLRNSWKLTPVKKAGNEREITLYADASIAPYAPFVEHGHMIKKGQLFKLPDGSWRRTSKTRWWEGYHMAADSIKKVQEQFPAAYERSFARFVRGLGMTDA